MATSRRRDTTDAEIGLTGGDQAVGEEEMQRDLGMKDLVVRSRRWRRAEVHVQGAARLTN